MCFVLNLSGVSELLPSSPSFEMIISRRLMALAPDSGTSLPILRESIPALRISVVSPVHSSPRPLSAGRDAPSKYHELFGAADDMYQRATALSGAAEKVVGNSATRSWVVSWISWSLMGGDLGWENIPTSGKNPTRMTSGVA